MRTPPFLLGAALLFWGWQTDYLIEGAAMAAILEVARFVKTRWELSDEDFGRIWTFCALLFLAAVAYALTNNEGPATLRGLLENPNFNAARNAGATSTKTAVMVMRWLPMIFFLFIVAQEFSPRAGISLEMIFPPLRRRRQAMQKAGQTPPVSRQVNISYPYYTLCLFAASGHHAEDNTFFWGLCVLLIWALWPLRSRRFSLVLWAGVLALSVVLGYGGQRGLVQLQQLLGRYNPQWFARFVGHGFDPMESRTEIGRIGQKKTSGKIVIRIESPNGTPPAYLREASYRIYKSSAKSSVWDAGSSRNAFSTVAATNETTFVLQPGVTNPASVNIACYLEGARNGSPAGLLPVPMDSGRLENLPAYVLEKNSAGAVFAEGPGLVIFNALYGSGATMDSAPDTNEDLAVPDREKPALEQVISEFQLKGRTPTETRQKIEKYFGDKFQYSLWQETPRGAGTNETALSRFLLKTHSGHCEYFATATVLLLRELNIPARYAVGYAVHESSGGKKYVVRSRDAHAWCLVWQNGAWQTFDTTPGYWLDEEGKRASAFQFLSDCWSRLGFEISKFRWGQGHLRKYILMGLLPVLFLLLYQIVFRRKRKGAQPKPDAKRGRRDWPGLDSEFYALERKLAASGVARQPSETFSDWLQRVTDDPNLKTLRPALQRLLILHYRYRFDPHGLNQSEREALRREVVASLSSLSPTYVELF